mmetsp:Transcript_105256/g.293018  ORF Transcript_105256/g.293018 Transcript_105256/m.293018 type:complete len:200 (-) Transcript_105256:516-1115(-)
MLSLGMIPGNSRFTGSAPFCRNAGGDRAPSASGSHHEPPTARRIGSAMAPEMPATGAASLTATPTSPQSGPVPHSMSSHPSTLALLRISSATGDDSQQQSGMHFIRLCRPSQLPALFLLVLPLPVALFVPFFVPVFVPFTVNRAGSSLSAASVKFSKQSCVSSSISLGRSEHFRGSLVTFLNLPEAVTIFPSHIRAEQS